MDVAVSYHEYFGSIIPDTFLSASQNVFLSFFGGMNSGTLTDASGVITLGETVSIDGTDFTYRGHGSAQPGVDVLGLILPLGFPVDVLILEEQSTGDTFFVYPDGAPNILGAIALTFDISEEGYNLSTNGPICFVAGTRLETPSGPRVIEEITAGDHVQDADGAPLRVLWAGHQVLRAPLKDWPPIVFEAGALGPGMPSRRLKLSPWHRLPLPIANGATPLLAPAKAFTVLPKVRQSRSLDGVSYHHILTERHGIVLAEGQPAETLLLAEEARARLEGSALEAIAEALGCEQSALSGHPAAQPCGRLLSMSEARQLLKALLSAIDAPRELGH